MVARLVVTVALLAVIPACGGRVESTGNTGGSGQAGGGTAGASNAGSGAAGQADGGPISDDEGGGGGSVPGCVSMGGNISRRPDGGCGQAFAFGSCGGDLFEVDCLCPNGNGACICKKNGKQTGMVGYDCASCPDVGDSWAACGFP